VGQCIWRRQDDHGVAGPAHRSSNKGLMVEVY
jgi:hypothetical protein